MAKKAAAATRIQNMSFNLGASLPHFTKTKFRRCVAHIEAIFLKHLRDVHHYVLDGSSLIFIHFGTPSAEVDLAKKGYFQNVKGQWSACYIDPFDHERYFALDEEQQDQLVTSLVEKTLSQAARMAKADSSPIHEIARILHDGKYSARFVIPKLTSRNDATGYTGSVWAHFQRGMIRWLLVVTDEQGKELHRDWISDTAMPDATLDENLLESKWQRNTFSLCGKNRRAVYRFEVPT